MRHGSLDIAGIRAGLACRRVGRKIELVDSVASSNDVAWQRVEAGCEDGLVILAEHQRSGRGRFGRVWESPRGASVLCSVVIVDESAVLKGGLPGLICAVAACDAIRSAAAVPAEIRWPNDLVVNGRKVGGVLVESRPRNGGGRVFVAGMGINCLQQAAHFGPELRERATSLELESPGPIDRTGVARSLVQALDAWLAEAGPGLSERVRAAWLARAGGLGLAIRLRQGGREYSGVVLDLDPTLALVVQLDQGGRMLFEADSTTVQET